MNCLNNIFLYITSREISVFEKLLLFAVVIIYVLSPVDVLPFNPLDDIGAIGIATAYVNWRIKRIESQKQSQEPADSKDIIDVQTIESSKKKTAFVDNFFTRKR